MEITSLNLEQRSKSYRYLFVNPVNHPLIYQYVYAPTPELQAYYRYFSNKKCDSEEEEMALQIADNYNYTTNNRKYMGMRVLTEPTFFQEIVIMYKIKADKKLIKEFTETQRKGTKAYVLDSKQKVKGKSILWENGFEPTDNLDIYKRVDPIPKPRYWL